MNELDAKFPGYGFAQHKGYGTEEHRDAVLRIGGPSAGADEMVAIGRALTLNPKVLLLDVPPERLAKIIRENQP
mgnify:CR=1 FL=1